MRNVEEEEKGQRRVVEGQEQEKKEEDGEGTKSIWKKREDVRVSEGDVEELNVK